MGSFATIVRAALGLGLALLVAASSAPSPGDARDGLFDGMPGVEIRYYDLPGKTVAQIRASGRRLGPVDPVTGKRVAGYTRWHLDWDAPEGADGRCRLDRADVTLDVVIMLPRLADDVPPSVLRPWQRFVTALKAHEATHARIAHEGREEMLRAIKGADCATASEAAAEAAAALEGCSADYDEATQHGLIEGAHFP